MKFGSVVMSKASIWSPEIVPEAALYRNAHLVLEYNIFCSRCSGTENLGFQETSAPIPIFGMRISVRYSRPSRSVQRPRWMAGGNCPLLSATSLPMGQAAAGLLHSISRSA